MKYEHNFWIVRQNMDWAHYDHMYKDEESILVHESSEPNEWNFTKINKHIHFGYETVKDCDHIVLHSSHYPRNIDVSDFYSNDWGTLDSLL